MEAVLRARNIEILILDVDGVLTDGGLYYTSEGQAMKRFHVQDGLGIKVAQSAGLEIAVITGLNSQAVERRIRELGVSSYYPGRVSKIPCLLEIVEERRLRLDQVAFLGDDWADAGVMRKVGLPMAGLKSPPEILDLALWVSRIPGGSGAVREAINFILQAQGKLEESWRKWSEEDHS